METRFPKTITVVLTAPYTNFEQNQIRLAESNSHGRWAYVALLHLALRQWLPTNHRLYYGDSSPFQRETCLLCLMGSKEDIFHTLLVCPALSTPRFQLNQALQGICKVEAPFPPPLN